MTYPGPGTGRIALVELLRLVAMGEIIAFHLFGPLPILDGLGLPIFLLLSVAFSVVAVERHGVRAIALGKLRGIGLPWIGWSGIYAVFFGLIGLRHGVPLSRVFNARMLLYGSSEHLWFCPFIIVAGVGTALLHRWTRRHASRWKPAVTLVIAFGCLLLIGSEGVIDGLGARGFPAPFWAWYFSSPSLLLGLAMGQVFLLSREHPRWMEGLALVALLGAGATVALLPVEHLFRRYIVSFAVTTITFALGRRLRIRGRWIQSLSSLMLGVYLVHVIIGRVSYRFLSDHHLPWLIVVYAASLALVAWIRRTKLRRLV